MLESMKDKLTNTLSKYAQLFGEGYAVEGNSVARKEANQALQIDIPKLSTVLPYETVDGNLFINKNSIGFGFELAPFSGADESLTRSLTELLKERLPAGVTCQGMLFKHGFVGAELVKGFEPFLKKGGLFRKLAEKSLSFHERAIKKGYKNKANLSANLCDYKLYLCFSCPKGYGKEVMMSSLYQTIVSELPVIGFSHLTLDIDMLKTIINVLVTPNHQSIFWPNIKAENNKEDEPISNSCLTKESNLTVFDGFIDMDVALEDGRRSKTVAVNCHLSKYPEQFALWQSPDLFSNLYRAQKNISCPFLISFAIHGEDQAKMQAKAKAKSYSLAKNNNAIQNFMNPFLQEELDEWTNINQSLSRGEGALVSTCYNLVLYTDVEHQQRHTAQAISNYREMGFELRPANCTQWLLFLNSLPFMPSEGLWKGLKALDEVKLLPAENAANLIPVVADFKGSNSGLMLPTYRNQIFHLDNFDDKSFSLSNYNYITGGVPGSGKSQLEQGRLANAVARGEQVFVIDIGGSYKHLCEALDGVYVDASNITLNPFTLFDFEGVTDIEGEKVNDYIQIRDLIAIMASPNKPLEAIQLDWLLNAVQSAWKEKRAKACIDDVVNNLREQLSTKPQGDVRLSDLIEHLQKFETDGLYGKQFNGETPNFRENKFVVFELGALDDENKELCKIVTFVMIVIIQGQFYQSPRNLRKRCVIDEAWRYITDGDNDTASRFISQGFRTGRKHNACFCVIFHTLNDLSVTAQGRAIKACANIQHIMLQEDLSGYAEKHPDEFNEQQRAIIDSFGNAGSQGFASLMIRYGKNAYSFHRYFVDPYSQILFSTKGHEYDAVERYLAQGLSIDEAVSIVAKETLGD